MMVHTDFWAQTPNENCWGFFIFINTCMARVLTRNVCLVRLLLTYYIMRPFHEITVFKTVLNMVLVTYTCRVKNVEGLAQLSLVLM